MTIADEAIVLIADGRRALLAAGAEPSDMNLIAWLAVTAARIRRDVSMGHVRAGLSPVAETAAPMEIGSPTDIHEVKP